MFTAGAIYKQWDEIVAVSLESNHSAPLPSAPKQLSCFSRVLTILNVLKSIVFYYRTSGEYVLSFLSLLNGWVFIFYKPGIASLRCFRVFRLLWFYQIDLFREGMVFNT
jgi:hypothetical protein